MNPRKSLLLGLLALSFASGCGGSDHHSSNSGNATLGSATNSLNDALSGGSRSSLDRAASAFDAVYRKNPGDGRAALGYGLAQAGSDALALTELFESSRAARRTPLATSLARLAPTANLLARLGGKDRVSLSSILPGLSRSGGVTKSRDYPTSPTPAEVRAQLGDFAEDLDLILSRLGDDAKVDALETTPLQLQYEGMSVKLGRVEGYAFRSAARGAKALVDAALAYDVDYGNYDAGDNFLALFGPKLRTDGATIAAAEYLPAGGFATLLSDGRARVADMRTQLIGVADDGVKAIEAYRVRTPADWLTDIPAQAPSEAELASIQGDLTNLKAALTVPLSIPVTVGGVQVSITLDLPAFLENPPADLRAYFPDLRVSYDGGEVARLTPVPGSVEDATFGGLVGNGGVPRTLLDLPRTYEINVNDDPTTTGEVAIFAFSFFDPLGTNS